jgi:hypothetical protein
MEIGFELDFFNSIQLKLLCSDSGVTFVRVSTYIPLCYRKSIWQNNHSNVFYSKNEHCFYTHFLHVSAKKDVNRERSYRKVQKEAQQILKEGSLLHKDVILVKV